MVLLHSKHMIVSGSKMYFEDKEVNINYFSHWKNEKIIFVIVTAGAGPSVVAAHHFPSLPATTSIRWQNLSVSTRNCERQSTSSCRGRGVVPFWQNTEILKIILTLVEILRTPWACESEHRLVI